MNKFYSEGLTSQKATEDGLRKVCDACASACCLVCLTAAPHTRPISKCAWCMSFVGGQFEVVAVENFKPSGLGELDGQLVAFLKDSSQKSVATDTVTDSIKELQQCAELDIHMTTAITCPVELLTQVVSAEVPLERCGPDSCTFGVVLQCRPEI